MNITDLYFLKWIKKYRDYKHLYYFLIVSMSIFIFFTCYISIPILFFYYIGIIISKKDLLKKFGNSLHRHIKSVSVCKIITVIIILTVIFFSIALIIPLFIIPIIVIGYKMNNKTKILSHETKKAMYLDENKKPRDKNILSIGGFNG